MTRTVPIDRTISLPARMFLDMEKYGTMNVAVSYVFVVDGTLTADEVGLAVELLKAITPRMVQCIAPDASGREVWTPTDSEGQIDFVEMPPGSDVKAVLEDCSALQERAFPLDRQLWHVVYYSPLRDGRSALLVRLHHAIGNGGEVLTMLTSAFGIDSEATQWTDVPQADSAQMPPATQPHDGPVNSRRQRVSVLGLGSRSIWDAAASRHGVTSDALAVSLLADTMFRYWKRMGDGRDTVVITIPTLSPKLLEFSKGALGIHVPDIPVSTDLRGPDRLTALQAHLASEITESEQKQLEMLGTAAMAAPASAMSDVLLTPLVTMPAMAIRDRPVIDFSGFAPVTGTRVVASPTGYGGLVRLCLNVDASLVGVDVFDTCAREAWANLL